MSHSERTLAHVQLQVHAANAKRELECVLDCLGWPIEPTLSLAIDRLVVLLERPQT